MGRNAIDTGYYIEKYFPTHGIRYIAISDDYDSNSDHNGIMVSLKNMINEAYALEVGRKIRASKQLCINSGKYIGRIAPYGYLKSKTNKHILIPDENVASVVTKIFEMAGDGVAVSVIKNWLNDNEILPPRLYFHSIGLASDKELPSQKHWNIATVYSILHNRVYCGDVVQGKFKVCDGNFKQQPKKDWVIVENTHEALVSRELFERVHNLRSKQHERISAPKAFSENIFVGKVVCGHCGYSLQRTRYRSGSYAFRCRTNVNYSADDCTAFVIMEKDLKSLLFDTLNEQASVFGNISTSSKTSNEGEYKKRNWLNCIRKSAKVTTF